MERKIRRSEQVEIIQPKPVETKSEPIDYRWRDTYIERKELDILLDCWKRVADFEKLEEIEPQLAVIVADSGYGKTRLVHKFYETIVARHQQAADSKYWPGDIGRDNDTLAVNPQDQADFGQRLPFLWWGIKLPDQTTEKSTCEPVLSEAAIKLAPHLVTLYLARQKRKKGKEVAEVAFNLATLRTFEMLSDVATVLRGLKTMVNVKHWESSERQHPGAQVEQQKRQEAHDLIFEDLYGLLSVENRDMATIPMVLFIDDAQWIHCDTGLQQLLLNLMRAAKANHWPLMIIITHWEKEWSQFWEKRTGVPGMLRQADTGLPWHGWKEWRLLNKTDRPEGFIPLGYKFDLSRILEAALPGVYAQDKQRYRLIGRFDSEGKQLETGIVENARHLDELLRVLYNDRRYLVDKDISAALIEDWEQELNQLLGDLEYRTLISKRFKDLPEDQQDTLRWSSYQGIIFPEKLTNAIALQLKGNSQCPWQPLVNPESMIRRDTVAPGGVSEFSLSVYQSVIYDSLLEKEKSTLIEQLRNLIADWLQFGDFQEGSPVEANAAEEKRLCEIGLAVFEDWDDADAELLLSAVLSRLVRINANSHEYNQAYRYVLRLLDCLPENWDLTVIQFWDMFSIIETLVLFNLLEQAEKIALRLNVNAKKEGDSAEAQRDLSVSYDNLGNIAQANKDLSGAQEYYELGLEIRQALVKANPTPQAQRDLSISYEKLGHIAQANKDLTGAQQYYEQGLEISLALVKANPTPQAQRDLSVSYNKLGDIAQANNDLTGAQQYYEQGLEIRQALVKANPTPEAQRDLSVSYNQLGDIAQANKDLSGAQHYYEQDLEISLALVKANPTPLPQRDLSLSHFKLAQALANLDDLISVTTNLEQVVNLCGDLVFEQSDLDSWGLLLSAHFMRAELAADNDYQNEDQQIILDQAKDFVVRTRKLLPIDRFPDELHELMKQLEALLGMDEE